MVLVSYSDSEGSEADKPEVPTEKKTTPSTTKPDTKFAVDKSNPRKIRVNLQETEAGDVGNRDHDGEPATKRPRITGDFSGFNSMLPAPKKDTQSANGTKPPSNGAPRKVFSLKTGAEPGFSRESDAELRQLFAGRETDTNDADGLADKRSEGNSTGTFPDLASPSASPAAPPKQGGAIMFKPLSVAKSGQKKKKAGAKPSTTVSAPQNPTKQPTAALSAPTPLPKASLFSLGTSDEPRDVSGRPLAPYEPLVYQGTIEEDDITVVTNHDSKSIADPGGQPMSIITDQKTESLDSIASDLKLSASAKRQLLGRNHKDGSKVSSNIINFNTDQEYAANEAFRASGEQVQHNPVRAIAPGKHSLKQLVSAASGQKEALEESFASGRRNKKEAGSRYGWT